MARSIGRVGDDRAAELAHQIGGDRAAVLAQVAAHQVAADRAHQVAADRRELELAAELAHQSPRTRSPANRGDRASLE